MPTNDYSASDSLRVAAKVLPSNDPNNPKNPEFIAAAEAARQAANRAEAARLIKAANEAKAAAAQASAAASAAPQSKTAAPAQDPPRTRQKRRAHSSRRAASAQPAETSSERHERLCTICNHHDCEEIEREFINWIHPETIAHYYKIEWRSIYRHAHAKGLFPLRQRNLKFALGRMVELATQVVPTMDGVLRSIRAFSSLDRNGRWTEVPTHVVVSSGAQFAQSKILADSVKSLTVRTAFGADFPEKAADSDAAESPVLIDNENE
jgi:hypothetical protein